MYLVQITLDWAKLMLLVHDALLLQTTKQTNVNLRLTDYVRLNDTSDSNNYWNLQCIHWFAQRKQYHNTECDSDTKALGLIKKKCLQFNQFQGIDKNPTSA